MKKLIYILAILLVIPFAVEANPIDGKIFHYDNNGHYYAWINNPVNWDEANAEVEKFSLIFNSVLLNKWHLVTITSQNEQDFLTSTVLDLPNSWQEPLGTERAWIGLINIISTTNFEWITGEKTSYSNWYIGEPNNPSDTVGTLGRYANGGWNNEGIFNYQLAYLIEHSAEGIIIPIANAGPDQIICNELCDEIILDGTESYDKNGEIVSFVWELKHRDNPAYDMTADGETPTISDLDPGVYDVTLTVTNDAGATNTDEMVLTVQTTCNPCSILKGDFDSDGDVDGNDLKIFSQNFGTSPLTP